MNKLSLLFTIILILSACAEREGITEPGEAFYKVAELETVGPVNDLELRNGHIYAANGELGMKVISVSDPENPVILGEYDPQNGYSKGITILEKGARTFAFVAAGSFLGVYIVDVTNPAEPGWWGAIGGGVTDVVESIEDVAVVDTMLYVADRSGGLASFEIEDIEEIPDPHLDHRLRTRGYARGLAIRDSIIYVAVGEAGLSTVRHDPEKTSGVLEELGTADTPDFARDVVVSEDLIAFVADEDYGIYVFDVSDPWNPVELGSRETPGEARKLFLHGDMLLVADAWEGLTVLDVSRPDRPEIAGQYIIDGASSVTADDTYIYLGTEHNGLLILEW